MGRFGNFESPDEPIAVLREGYSPKDDGKVDYKISLVNTFELANLIKSKGNKGRVMFIQKLVACLGKPKTFMLKHFYDESSPQFFKVTNRNHKNWVLPFNAERFEPDV
jgi:hypothetical protein